MLGAAAAAGGCYTSADVGTTATYSASASADTSSPDLVEVSPGVQVVADYDEPVFYSDGFYWRWYENGWYRSNNYYSGWGYYERPPAAIVRIDSPYNYRHYRPSGYVTRRQAPYRRSEPVRREVVRDHREPARTEIRREPERREVVRDHREAEPARAEPRRAAPPPAAPKDDHVRDHRH
ncbi:MAG TPA: hypothetical protein VGC42_19930 [Kofleriaceae bacterium]